MSIHPIATGKHRCRKISGFDIERVTIKPPLYKDTCLVEKLIVDLIKGHALSEAYRKTNAIN